MLTPLWRVPSDGSEWLKGDAGVGGGGGAHKCVDPSAWPGTAWKPGRAHWEELGHLLHHPLLFFLPGVLCVQILLISWLVQYSGKPTLWSSQRGYGKILQLSSTLFCFNIWEFNLSSCCASELLICNPLTKIQTYLIFFLLHLIWYLSQLWFRTHWCYKHCQKWLMFGVRYV